MIYQFEVTGFDVAFVCFKNMVHHMCENQRKKVKISCWFLYQLGLQFICIHRAYFAIINTWGGFFGVKWHIYLYEDAPLCYAWGGLIIHVTRRCKFLQVLSATAASNLTLFYYDKIMWTFLNFSHFLCAKHWNIAVVK